METTHCKRCGAPLQSGAPGGVTGARALQGMCTRCLLELGLDEDSSVVITGTAEAPAPPPSPEELQPLFPNHVIEAVLGQGGMGVVYRARQKGLDRPVALKVLPAKAGRDPSFAERFTREAQALASLNHPNITSVYDFGKAGDHHFLVMELVDGVNLRQLLRTQKVAPKQALQIVEQICDALQYAHDEGVVHRDIKPENILIDRKGRLKITDFGLAKLLGREEGPTGLTMSHQVMGTPHYMAPEQVEHPTLVDHRADIYSLGVVFYELLTGELPLGRFAPPSGKVQVDVKLDEVVLRALEKEPALRYQTASAVKSDVSGIREPGSGTASEPAGAASGGGAGAGRGGSSGGHRWHDPEGARGRRRVWPWVVAGLLLLLLLPVGLAMSAALFLGASSVRPVAEAEGDPDGAVHARNLDAVRARLEGVALFERDDGWMPSIALRNTFALSADTAAAVGTTLNEAAERYEALLDAHTAYRVESDSLIRVSVAAFPAEREALVADVERELFAILPDLAVDLLAERDAVATELFPQGADALEVDLRSADEGYAWTVVSGGAGADGAALPAGLEPYWERVFGRLVRPLAPSAVPPLERLLAELELLAAAAAEVRVRALEVSSGRACDTEHPVQLRIDLVVVAESSARATELLDGMLARLRATGIVTRLGDTVAHDDGTAITATGVTLCAPAPNPGLPGSLEDASGGDLSFALRSAAAAAQTGEIRVSTRSLYQGRGFGDVEYDVTFLQGPFELETLLTWMREVEALGRDSVVAEVSLRADKQEPGRWQGGVEVRGRHPR